MEGMQLENFRLILTGLYIDAPACVDNSAQQPCRKKATATIPKRKQRHGLLKKIPCTGFLLRLIDCLGPAVSLEISHQLVLEQQGHLGLLSATVGPACTKAIPKAVGRDEHVGQHVLVKFNLRLLSWAACRATSLCAHLPSWRNARQPHAGVLPSQWTHTRLSQPVFREVTSNVASPLTNWVNLES